MAKEKQQTNPKRPKKYNEKLTVNGSFLDIINAVGKSANKK